MAEREPVIYHAPPGKFDRLTGKLVPKKPCDGVQPPKYQVVFGRTMIELAESNPKVLGITAAMPTGSSLDMLMNKMPHRAFDVGIAEQHAVTFAAGLATQGFVPFCVIYSTFLQRAFDQIIHDVALQNLNVVFCIDRAGVVGEDGATHQGAFDLAYLRCIPNMTICAPMNEQELRNMMYTAQLADKGPWAIRYPRGRGVMENWKTPLEEILSATGRRLNDGSNLAILSIGHIGNEAAKAVEILREEDIEAAHYDVRFLKPLDEKMLHEVFKKFRNIITVEDGVIAGGFGSAVLEFMADHQYSATVIRLGIPDLFVEHGDRNLMIHELGYDAQAIAAAARKLAAAFSPLHH